LARAEAVDSEVVAVDPEVVLRAAELAVCRPLI
jgi:hypothetical protein